VELRTGARQIGDQLHRTLIREHVTNFWPNSLVSEELQGEGPIRDSLPGFAVIKVEPRSPGEPYVYVTYGCFASKPIEHIRHEFFIISPRRDESHVQTLTMLANFHADARYRLDVGRVVGIGDPWMEQSSCDHLLVSLPYPYGPKLEWLRLKNICVRFLWLMPITAMEAAYAELNGVQALEERFDKARPDYLNPNRPSVI
jgi:hypothetical protein